MLHPASRLEVVIHARSDGRNAVKSAAYTARSTFYDERRGQRFSAGKSGGLLSHELINWRGSPESLWNAAEAAERRSNSRVIREIRPSLPRELPLSEQIALVRDYSRWLHEEYGVAIQADIHAPRFFDAETEKKHTAGKLKKTGQTYLEALFDQQQTNQNFHAHILMTTRRVCPKSGKFSAKTRILDDRKSGPQEIKNIRQVWEEMTNAALKKVNSVARIDMRSYLDKAKAGEAPEGLLAQNHMGPRRAAFSRRLTQEGGKDTSSAGKKRNETKSRNEELWKTWFLLQKLRRKKEKEEDLRASQRAAMGEGKSEVAVCHNDKAKNQSNAEALAEQDMKRASAYSQTIWERAISAANEEPKGRNVDVPSEFEVILDMDTYMAPPSRPHPEPYLKVTEGKSGKGRQRVR